MINRYPNFRYVVYTGDTDVSSETILSNVASRFNINLASDSVEFIFLKQRDWVEAHHYPHLTLLLQSLGSLVLGLEALKNFVPGRTLTIRFSDSERNNFWFMGIWQMCTLTPWDTHSLCQSLRSLVNPKWELMSITQQSAQICLIEFPAGQQLTIIISWLLEVES